MGEGRKFHMPISSQGTWPPSVRRVLALAMLKDLILQLGYALPDPSPRGRFSADSWYTYVE